MYDIFLLLSLSKSDSVIHLKLQSCEQMAHSQSIKVIDSRKFISSHKLVKQQQSIIYVRVTLDSSRRESIVIFTFRSYVYWLNAQRYRLLDTILSIMSIISRYEYRSRVCIYLLTRGKCGLVSQINIWLILYKVRNKWRCSTLI